MTGAITKDTFVLITAQGNKEGAEPRFFTTPAFFINDVLSYLTQEGLAFIKAEAKGQCFESLAAIQELGARFAS